MRLISMASALVAVVGTTPSVVGFSETTLNAPEPMWLALWGFALIAASSRLHGRMRRARPRPESVDQPSTTDMDAINASLASQAS